MARNEDGVRRPGVHRVTFEELNSIAVKHARRYRLDVVGADLGAGNTRRTALEGLFINESGHGGMSLHATDVCPPDDLEARFLVGPSLTICICLDGGVDAEIGAAAIRLDASEGPVGKIWSITRNEAIVRRSAAGRRDRKILIVLEPAWFEDAELGDSLAAAGRIRREHLAVREWRPSSRSVRCAEEILRNSSSGDGLVRLAREALAIELVCEALGAVSEQYAADDAAEPTTRDVARARRARAFIEGDLGADLSLGSIARSSGMSVSTLQRVFKNSFGVTVVEFVRRKRLEEARRVLFSEGASVAQAAAVAGYNNPTSFATAYLRAFGHPPSRTSK